MQGCTYTGDPDELNRGFESARDDLQKIDGFSQAYFCVDRESGKGLTIGSRSGTARGPRAQRRAASTAALARNGALRRNDRLGTALRGHADRAVVGAPIAGTGS